MFKYIIPILSAIFLNSSLAKAEYPASLAHYVNDFANVIDDAEEKLINEKLKAFDLKTTNEIVFVTLPVLESGDLEGTVNNLFRQWGIGKKEKNNGLLFIIFMKGLNNKGSSRIEVGTGLEGVLTDGVTKVINEKFVRPHFVNKDFAKGFSAAADKFVGALDPIVPKDSTSDDSSLNSHTDNKGFFAIIIIAAFGLLAFILYLIIQKIKGNSDRDTFYEPFIVPNYSTTMKKNSVTKKSATKKSAKKKAVNSSKSSSASPASYDSNSYSGFSSSSYSSDSSSSSSSDFSSGGGSSDGGGSSSDF